MTAARHSSPVRILHLRPLLFLVLTALSGSTFGQFAEPAALAAKTQADFDAAVAATRDPALKVHTAAITTALLRKSEVDVIVATVSKAGGTFAKKNVTPEALKKALGTELAIFDTLKMVNLASSGQRIKGKRESDPFDHAFYEHLGQLTDLESLTILNTTVQNDDLIEVAKLKNLQVLKIINQSKLTDEGLAHLARLNQLSRLSIVGTTITGQPFKDFAGWTNLKTASFRASKIDDQGLEELCDHFPNLESLSLAHTQFTDAGAVHLAKLKNLKGFEIGTRHATPECLRNLLTLPIEYLQLGEGVGTPAAIAIVKDLKTLRRLTITGARDITDAEMAVVAGMTQLEHVELGAWDLTEARLPVLQRFAFLKSMRLVRPNDPYKPDIRAKVQAILPKVDIRFD